MNENSRLPEDEMEMQIWEYIDGLAGDEQRLVIERLIREDAAWKERHRELLEVHQSLNMLELEHPSMRFTKNVMEEIGRLQIGPAAKKYINGRIIFGIAGFFGTVILAFLVYALSQVKWSDGADTKAPLGIDFSKVDYTSIFNNNFVNGFMMLNVILGLLLFDRYLNNKKIKMMENDA